MLRRLVLSAFVTIALSSPIAAQWQVPSGAIPVGRGPGVTGFNSVAGSGGTGTKCLTDTNPPTFAACPGAGGSPGAPSGSVQYNNGGSFAGNAGFTYAAGGAVTIAPTPSTINQGLIITQSSPTSGSATGSLSYNVINVNNQVSVTTAGQDSGSLPNTTVSAFRSNMITGGTNVQGQPLTAGTFSVQNTIAGPSTSGDLIGVLGAAYSNITHNSAGLYAMNALVRVGASGSENQIVGIESDVIIFTGGSSITRMAFNATAGGNIPASGNLDAAFVASSATGTGQFKHFMLLSNVYTFAPIVTTGDILAADTAFTVANVINLPTMVVTGNIFSFPNFIMNGNGAANFGTNGAVGTAGTVNSTCASCGGLSLNPSTNSTSGVDYFQAVTSAGTNVLAALVGEPSYTTSFFGQTAGNWGIIRASGAANLGLMIGTATSVPLILGTNNTARLTINGAGGGTWAGGALAMSTNAITGLTTLASAGAMTFQSNGSTFAGQITTGQQWEFGPNNVTPLTGPILTITKNTATPPAVTLLSTNDNLLNLVGSDTNNAGLTIQAFGTARTPLVRYFQARGTAASPTATQSTDAVGSNFAYAYYTSGGPAYSAGAGFVMTATDNCTSTVCGVRLDLYATPTGSATVANAVSVGAGLMVGTTADPGAGSAQLNAQFFMPNITQTSAAQNGTVCWTTGTGKFTVDTTVGCLSSIMGAKNITERLVPDQALAIVDKLSPFAFRYKKGWGDSGHYEQFGLGAEEVAQIDERLVGRDPNGTLQGVRYQELTAVLAGAIKELKADNDNLRVELKKARK